MNKIPKGYKQTEVGVIPEDWEVRPLGSEIESLEAGVSVNSVDEEFQIYAHEESILKTSAVLNGEFRPHECKKIAPKDIPRAKLKPRANTIIISRMNTPDLVGECGYVDRDYPYLYLPDRLWMTRIHRGSNLCVKWLTYLFSIREYKAKIKCAATGTSGSMKNISKDSLLEIDIPFPDEQEQTAIAAALSDADALIKSLEKLIDKKRLIKQGAMQESLKPKEGWVVKKLGEIADLATGNTPPTNDQSNYGEEFFFVSPADLGKGKWILETDKKLTKKGFALSRKFPKNSILYTCIGSTIGKAGMAKEELTSNQQINAVMPNDNFSSDYLYYSLNLFAPRIKSLASEQAVPIINKSDFSEICISLPPTLAEQTRIATILSDMDSEISALVTKLAKYKQVKQGMMQELLTGKTRLI